jgi:hypothetical protein
MPKQRVCQISSFCNEQLLRKLITICYRPTDTHIHKILIQEKKGLRSSTKLSTSIYLPIGKYEKSDYKLGTVYSKHAKKSYKVQLY